MSFPAYGLNWNYLSRSPNAANVCEGFPDALTPVSMAAVAKPADTVLMTDAKYIGDSAGRYSSHYVGSPAALWAPDTCTWSDGGWGIGSIGDTINYAGRKTYTGVVAMRHTGGTNVAFCDGHVKFMTPGRLAAGTNWKVGINGTDIQITDLNQYLWDLE